MLLACRSPVRGMIPWDSLGETALAVNWPKMMVDDADKHWQVLLPERQHGNAWFRKLTQTHIFTQPLWFLAPIANRHTSAVVYILEIQYSRTQMLPLIDPVQLHWVVGGSHQNCLCAIWKTTCGNLVTSTDRDGQVGNKLWPERQSISWKEEHAL